MERFFDVLMKFVLEKISIRAKSKKGEKSIMKWLYSDDDF